MRPSGRRLTCQEEPKVLLKSFSDETVGSAEAVDFGTATLGQFPDAAMVLGLFFCVAIAPVLGRMCFLAIRTAATAAKVTAAVTNGLIGLMALLRFFMKVNFIQMR